MRSTAGFARFVRAIILIPALCGLLFGSFVYMTLDSYSGQGDSIPESPDFPNVFLVVAGGLGFGLALGIGYALLFARQEFRQRGSPSK